MLYLYIALLFGMIWWVANKELGNKFNKPLKYASLGMICILALVDVFMFVEMERFVKTASIDVGGTGIGYSYMTKVCPDSELLIKGTLISGSYNDLCTIDNVSEVIESVSSIPSINSEYYFNATNPYSLTTKVRYNDSEIFLQYHDGMNWSTLATFTNSSDYYTITVLLAPMGITATKFRFYDDKAWEAPNTDLDIDYLVITNDKFTPVYSSTSSDTASIVGYHYSEYWAIEFLVGMLPDIAGVIIFLAIVQYMMILYTNTYGSFKDRQKEKKGDTQ